MFEVDPLHEFTDVLSGDGGMMADARSGGDVLALPTIGDLRLNAMSV